MEGVDLDALARAVVPGAEQRIDWVPIPAWVAGPDLVRRHFNPSWSQLAGRRAETERDERWLTGVHPEDRDGLQRAYAATLQSPSSFQAQYRLRDASGEYHHLLEAGSPYYDQSRGLMGFAGVCLDIGDGRRGPRGPQENEVLTAAERRRMEEILRESEARRASAEREARLFLQGLAHVTRMTTLAELWASLAHDLSQPITAILSNAQSALRLLSGGRSGPSTLRPILHDIASDAECAGEMFRRVRGLLKAGHRERQQIDVNEIVRDVAALLHTHALFANVGVSLELCPTLPGVCADRVQIRQVILNLMLNALEAMQTTPAAGRRLHVTTEQPDSLTVKVSLRDTGKGVSPAEMDRVFSPGTTSKANGLGMGLFVSRSIAHAHGGRMWIENNPDGGATVSFYVQVSGAMIDE